MQLRPDRPGRRGRAPDQRRACAADQQFRRRGAGGRHLHSQASDRRRNLRRTLPQCRHHAAGGDSAVHRGVHQVGAFPVSELAVGGDGGADAGVGHASCRDHGQGRGLSGHAHHAGLSQRQPGDDGGGLRRGALLRGRRAAGMHPEQRQAGAGLLHHLQPRAGGGLRRDRFAAGLCGGPRDHQFPRDFQGAAVPLRGPDRAEDRFARH
ncbi:hypothetical protein SDC9_132453 [bioreactor metagenome]|uniref:Uncharacterized protein n=1 Tax=bioreactor metagenome TaxID=1076179 RepID=A0A645D8U7_9ZZZZ